MNDDVRRLLACRHHDPHSVLGVHGSRHGGVFRCVRPGASVVQVLRPGEEPVFLHWTGAQDGVLWEGDLPGAQHGPALTVRAQYPDGSVWECQDPYSFLPTFGDTDIYLIAEGRHWLSYKKLGAQRIEHQGVWGTAFTLWAPGVRAWRWSATSTAGTAG